MKKFVTFSLFIFVAIITGVAAVGLVSNQNNQPITNLNTGNAGLTNQFGISVTGVNSNAADLILSKTELAKHNSANSCWLLISGKIYDVTSFLPSHPGEAKTILPTCGTDATPAYATKNKQDPSSHSASANSMLAAYYVGDLNQTLKLSSGRNNTSSTQTNITTQTTTKASITPATPTTQNISPNIKTTLALTSAELTKHNSGTSCWLLISGRIYDATSYIKSHPGGAAEILNNCGTDATAAFSTRGGTGSHSSSAQAALANYYIGDLNQTVMTNLSNPTSPSVANPTFTPTTSGGNDEEDD